MIFQIAPEVDNSYMNSNESKNIDEPLSGMDRFIQIIIKARGKYSVREFSEKLGLAHTTLRRLEAGLTKSPDQSTLNMLAEYTPYNADELRAIIEERPPAEIREMVTAEDFLKIAKDLPPDEIARLAHLLIDYLRHPAK